MGKKAHIFIPSIGYEGDINLNAEAELNQEFTVKVRRIRLPYLQAVFEQV